MTSLSSQPYKGSRDYYPADKQLQNYIFDVWQSVVERFGYQQYGAPLIEPLEIYAAKSGQELVTEQTYTFSDRGGRTVAIRPEMTPSISRMVAARRQELSYPARFYSIANFMRYERPQRGREREFWQLNVDVFGIDSLQADIEIVTIADTIMKQLGATSSDYSIRLNNRKFISYMMAQYLGLDEVQAQQMSKLLDRRTKISVEDFQGQLAVIFGSEDDERIKKIIGLLEAGSIDGLTKDVASSEGMIEIMTVIQALKKAGVTEVVFDASLMRGLDYYTGTVFEVFDTHPDNNRSLFGGGRYDGLVGLFGAEPLAAVGMAPGSTMIENFLTVRGLAPRYISQTDIYVIAVHDTVETSAQARQLRDAGLNVEQDFSQRKIDKKIKAAVKKNIPYILFIGENDTTEFSLKNVVTNEEKRLTIDAIIAEFASR